MKDKIIKKNSAVTLKGVYKFTKAKITTPKQWALHDRILEFKEAGEYYMHLVKRLNKMCETKVYEVENIIPTCGRTLIANNLANASPTDVMLINYTAIGTGTTAVANGDTTLVTETYRKATASYTNSNNIAYVTAFYSATDCDDTYYEHGLFSNATGSADSGVLFSRVLLNDPTGITKSNTETLTIDYNLTIS